MKLFFVASCTQVIIVPFKLDQYQLHGLFVFMDKILVLYRQEMIFFMAKMKYWNGTTWETLDAKDADTVDGKHFTDIQNDAQAKADAALNSAKQYTDQEVGEVAQALAEHKAETASINTIGHVYAAEFTATLSTSWSGSAAPYTQTVTINGITSAHNPIIDVVMSGTYSTDQQRIEQWGYIYRAVTGTNQITFYASEKPTVSLPIRVKVVM